MLCRGTRAEVCDQQATMRVTDPDGGWCQRHYQQWKRGQLDVPFTPAFKPAQQRPNWGRQVGENHKDAKLTEPDVRELRRLRDEEGYSFPELSRRFGIHEQTARKAYRGTTWGHVDHDAPR